MVIIGGEFNDRKPRVESIASGQEEDSVALSPGSFEEAPKPLLDALEIRAGKW